MGNKESNWSGLIEVFTLDAIVISNGTKFNLNDALLCNYYSKML